MVEVRVVTALFTKRYLQYIDGPYTYPSERLVVFRSEALSLKPTEGRVKALIVIITLLRYLKSGNARMEIMNLVLT